MTKSFVYTGDVVRTISDHANMDQVLRHGMQLIEAEVPADNRLETERFLEPHTCVIMAHAPGRPFFVPTADLRPLSTEDLAAARELSLKLQGIAAALTDVLKEATGGKDVPFVLVLQVGHVAQYVANCKREEGTALIESLLARWKLAKPDVPAHVRYSSEAPGG